MFHTISLDNVSNARLRHIVTMSTSTGVMHVKQMIISTYSYGPELEEYITKRLSKLGAKDYRPTIKVEEEDQATFVTCLFPPQMPPVKQKQYFKEYMIMPIAKAMVDIIQKEFAVDYANEMIQSNYDLKEIVITRMRQSDLKTEELRGPIITKMMENKPFCLDGWIQFRLANYKSYIIDMVDHLIREYKTYQEYEEFIILLKEYILSQAALVDQVHIMPAYNGNIELYDNQYTKITETSKKDHDDLILGTLLNLAPLNVTIHKKERYNNISLIHTIAQVYQSKITLCPGCENCNKSRFNKGLFKKIKAILTHKKL